MSETHEDQNRRRWGWGTYSLMALLVLVIYPLSVGPFVWLAVRLDPKGESLNLVYLCLYSPLRKAYEILGEPEWFTDYLRWWAKR